MKKLIAILFLVIITILFVYKNSSKTAKYQSQFGKNIPTLSSVKNHTQSESTVIFIPYWNIPKSIEEVQKYDRLLYFGVSVNKDGINREEIGYKNLKQFNFQKTSLLTIRMLDDNLNKETLKDKETQKKIIEQSIEIAKENNFSGLALDLELTSLFNPDIKDQINIFVKQFYTECKKAGVTFSFISYGDVFYRQRPFDIATISKYSDEIMLMAYDFHKSYGEPGPNFPFNNKEKYGYDFQQMIDDYLKFVPSGKLTVIFGMYGYDWTLNKQGTPLKKAQAMSLKQINKLVESPKLKVKGPDIDKMIKYKDEEGYNHIVWYEDEESAKIKQDYLKSKSIGNVGYWVYGYF